MSGVQDSHNPSDYSGAIALEQQEDMWLTNVPPKCLTLDRHFDTPIPLGKMLYKAYKLEWNLCDQT
ncbi:hypothetical protein DRN44_09050 [Thermococci archaeon]|nr:MAG: hypothetical protein DRN44_09050 [Thermococci archaeon]